MEKCAVLGPKYSFTDLAFQKIRKKSRLSPTYQRNIQGIFHAVIDGKARYGIVPVKNSLIGNIPETVVLLKKYKKKVIVRKKIRMPIHYVLCTRKNISITQIQQIISHPVVFKQCKKFLEKYLPTSKKIFTSSSSAACESLKLDKKFPKVAAIASKEAAHAYKLKIIKRNIGDSRRNYTDFVLISISVEV